MQSLVKWQIIVLIFFQNSYGQIDSLISYNPRTDEIYTFAPNSYDTSKVFDFSNSYVGDFPGIDLLSNVAPDCTYNDSYFSDYLPARDYFIVNNYPSRAAVKLFYTKNDTLKQYCSGIMISDNYLLTANHCTGRYDTNGVKIFKDSIWAYPAYDNGLENPVFGKSLATEYITFKSNLKQNIYKKDMTLIKLADKIGEKTGWVGIGYSKDDSFYFENVFHKFSYPGTSDPSDSSRVFNGDTLYYNYGLLDLVDQSWLGYDIFAIPGMSGSSLIYTNNNDRYFSVGTLVFATNSRHMRITAEVFYAFKQVLDNDVTNITTKYNLPTGIDISDAYPNPFNEVTNINLGLWEPGNLTIKIINLVGKEVSVIVNNQPFNPGAYIFQWNAENIASGLYFIFAAFNEETLTKKVILLK